jgi:biotin carboxylase
MKTLLVVKSGYPLPLRMPAYREFFKLNWKVVVVDKLLNQSLRFADSQIIHNLDDIEGLAKIIKEKIGTPDGILTFNDSALVQTAQLAKLLGLNFIDVETAKKAVNKISQRKLFEESGIPVPNWREVSSSKDVKQYYKEWGKLVIKPADRSASAGVYLIRDENEINYAYSEAKRESFTKTVYVEEYVEGPEISIESIVIDGIQKVIAITDKITTDGPTFIELGHSIPSSHPEHLLQQAVQIALKACESLGIRNGACHTEIKLTDNGPVLIEVNPRLPGDCIVDLIQIAYGINLYKIYGKMAMGEKINEYELIPSKNQAAAIRFHPSLEGKVLLNAKSNLLDDYPEWLHELSVIQEIGEEMPALNSNAGRIAYAIVSGRDSKEAVNNAQKAIESIELTTVSKTCNRECQNCVV